MVGLDWDEAYRIVFSRYPSAGIFDRVADPADLPAVWALEARTNARVRHELREVAFVRPTDRVVGPGTPSIMAAFTQPRASRFSDGSFGIYYVARHRDTAIAETVHHVASFYAATNEASADIDMRAYVARVAGRFQDLSFAGVGNPLLDPNSYATSQPYGASIRAGYDVLLHHRKRADGIVYPSVRDASRRHCVACFRPLVVSSSRTHSHLTYRWDGLAQRISGVTGRVFVPGFGPMPAPET